MNYEDKFVQAEVSNEEGVFTRLDDSHPVGFFLGIERGARTVMIVCPAQPPEAPLLGSIDVEVRRRADERWALVLRLARPELKKLFSWLIEDLDTATRKSSADPGRVVIERLVRWQRLLSRGTPNVLDDFALRGLAAELIFLTEEAITAFGARRAVSGWGGPFEAPKDFGFERAEVEVKAVRRNNRTVTITSLEQLSDAGLPLYLWTRTVELEIAQEPAPSSFTSLVGRARAAVSHDGEAAERLELALHAANYEDRAEYSTRLIQFGSSACYRVATGFPRLERAQVAPSIVSCRYEIAVTELARFQVKTWNEEANDH